MATPTRQRARRIGDDNYMDLIREFPLKTIKTDAEHARAVAMIAKLIGRALTNGAGDYLDMLILITNKYEDEHHTPVDPNLSPRQALRAIMDADEMTRADMGRIIGSEPAVSMFLKGERELSKNQIKALVARFRVDANLFL